MSSVDNRVVSMKFDNQQFEKGVNTTISTLDKLKKSLHLDGATKGIQDVQAASSKFSLKNMEAQATGVSKSFLGMATVGITAISNLTNRAVDAGINMAKSLTISPISAGLQEYETNLSSIQTILANTRKEGANLKDVNKALDTLNTYSDQTIYNFSEMARNIGTFTAAGVKLDPSVKAIKGISNLAAISGSNAEQASTAMYQLSQALAAGKVGLQDWNSVVNAGMGGAVFQDALKRTARNHGIAVDAIIKKEGSFRESLKKGWISGQVLTETLSQFTGDLTDKQLKAQGYTAKQIKDIQALAKTAKTAATQVKTASQLMGTLQETAGSGWAKTWSIIFGDFGEAPKLFTSLNNTIGGIISRSADARNKMLQEWKDAGGRTALIDGIKNVFEALGKVIGPVKEAFREIFPPMTGKTLASMTKAFEAFTERLIISDGTAERIKATFKGLFSIFALAKTIVVGALKGIGAIFGAFAKAGGSAGGGILTLTASIGNFLTKVVEFIKQSGAIEKVFVAIGTAIGTVIKFIADLVGALGSLVQGKESTFLDGLVARFQALGPILDWVKQKLQGVRDVFANLVGALNLDSIFGGGGEGTSSKLNTVTAGIQNVGDAAENTISIFDRLKNTAGRILAGIGHGLAAAGKGMVNFVKNLNFEHVMLAIDAVITVQVIRTIKKFMDAFAGIAEAYKNVFEDITGMFSGVTDTMSAMQKNLKADALMKIAAAILLLAIALWILSKVEYMDIVVGLGALFALFKMLSKAMDILERSTDNGLKGAFQFQMLAVSLVIFAAALVLLAGALWLLGKMDPQELAQGMLVMGGVLALLTASATALGKFGGGGQMIAAATALAVLAGSLMLLAGVIKFYSGLDMGMLAAGLAKIAAVIVVLGLSMWTIPKDMTKYAAGLLILAVALKVLVGVIEEFSVMPLGPLATSLGALSIVLFTLRRALQGLSRVRNPEKGAVAILILAVALRVLTPVLETLSRIPLKNLAIAIGAIAVMLAVFVIAGHALAPVVGVLHAFAIALLLIGASIALAGAGMLLFATGLAALVAVGAAGAVAITGIIMSIAATFPFIAMQLGLALKVFAQVLANSSQEIFAALTVFVHQFLQYLRNVAPDFFATMLFLLNELLRAIDEALPELITKGGDIIVHFLEGMTEQLPRIIQAGVDLIVAVLDGISKNIAKLVTAGIRVVVEFLKGVAKNMQDLVTAGIRVIVEFLKGIAKNIGDVVDAGVEVVVEFLDGVGRNVKKIVDAGVKLVIDILNGINGAITANDDEFIAAGRRLAGSILAGIGKAVLAWSPIGLATSLASKLTGAVKGALHINSPSKDFIEIGKSIPEGMTVGIMKYSDETVAATEEVGNAVILQMKDTMKRLNDAVDADLETTPVIAPILDLTQLRKDVTRLNSTLPASVSYSQASDISQSQAAVPETEVATITRSITFEQNNYSPKALSPAEVYRNTQNQLMFARELAAS